MASSVTSRDGAEEVAPSRENQKPCANDAKQLSVRSARDSVHQLDQMRARRTRLKRIAKVLRLPHDPSVLKFHDTHRIRRRGVVGEHEFRDPQIAVTDDSPHRKALFARLNGSALLDVPPTSDALAGLRIVEDGVFAVDVMFGLEIVSVRGSPMLLERCPYFAISHLHFPVCAVGYESNEASAYADGSGAPTIDPRQAR